MNEALAEALRGKVEGKAIAESDASYDDRYRRLVWNEIVPPRRPRPVCQVTSEQDVVVVVRNLAGAIGE